MVIISDGYSEIGAHFWIEIGNMALVYFNSSNNFPSNLRNLSWAIIYFKYHGKRLSYRYNSIQTFTLQYITLWFRSDARVETRWSPQVLRRNETRSHSYKQFLESYGVLHKNNCWSLLDRDFDMNKSWSISYKQFLGSTIITIYLLSPLESCI